MLETESKDKKPENEVRKKQKLETSGEVKNGSKRRSEV